MFFTAIRKGNKKLKYPFTVHIGTFLDNNLVKAEPYMVCAKRGYVFYVVFCYVRGKMLKIARAEVACGSGKVGEVLALDGKGEGGILVACGEGALLLREITPEGKGKMSAGDFIRGRKIKEGDILT